VVGEIHLAKIYFTDLSAYKVRPILIIKDLGDDCVCLQVTSKFKEDRIQITKSDFIDGSLKKESVLVVPKNFTLHKSILIKYLGKLSKNKQDEIFNIFCKELGCSH